MTLIEWLEQLWGTGFYEVAVREGQTTIHPANYTYFLDAASCITVVALVAVAALLFAGILNLCGSHR